MSDESAAPMTGAAPAMGPVMGSAEDGIELPPPLAKSPPVKPDRLKLLTPLTWGEILRRASNTDSSNPLHKAVPLLMQEVGLQMQGSASAPTRTEPAPPEPAGSLPAKGQEAAAGEGAVRHGALSRSTVYMATADVLGDQEVVGTLSVGEFKDVVKAITDGIIDQLEDGE